MISYQEKTAISNALSKGIAVHPSANIENLTLKIWENISSIPYPVECNFNIMGNSSIVNIISEKGDVVLVAKIDRNSIEFSLPFSTQDMSRDDSVAVTFSVMSIIGALNDKI